MGDGGRQGSIFGAFLVDLGCFGEAFLRDFCCFLVWCGVAWRGAVWRGVAWRFYPSEASEASPVWLAFPSFVWLFLVSLVFPCFFPCALCLSFAFSCVASLHALVHFLSHGMPRVPMLSLDFSCFSLPALVFSCFTLWCGVVLCFWSVEASEASPVYLAVPSCFWHSLGFPCFLRRSLLLSRFSLIHFSASSLTLSFEWCASRSLCYLLSLAFPCLPSLYFVLPCA